MKVLKRCLAFFEKNYLQVTLAILNKTSIHWLKLECNIKRKGSVKIFFFFFRLKSNDPSARSIISCSSIALPFLGKPRILK